MKYAVFDARIPPIDQTVFPTPRVKAWESTNRTAGPGVMHSTVSMTKNALHTCQVMPSSELRDRDRLGTARLGAELKDRLPDPFRIAIGRIDFCAVREVNQRDEDLGRRRQVRLCVESERESRGPRVKPGFLG